MLFPPLLTFRSQPSVLPGSPSLNHLFPSSPIPPPLLSPSPPPFLSPFASFHASASFSLLPPSCLSLSSPVAFWNSGGEQDGGQGVDSVPSRHSDAGMDRGSESDQLHKVSFCFFTWRLQIVKLQVCYQCPPWCFFNSPICIRHVHMWHALFQAHICPFLSSPGCSIMITEKCGRNRGLRCRGDVVGVP